MMQRIESFDILKGIGIILMIVAHTYGPNRPIWNFIYAFHMPLFFIVTGYFYKKIAISDLFIKNCNQLLIQYIALCFIINVLVQIRQPHNIQKDIINVFTGIGPSWFLLAMFLSRIEFHFILTFFPNHYYRTSFIISICVCFTTYFIELSSFLSFFPSLASLFFLSTGYYINHHNYLDHIKKHTITASFIGFVLWLITSLYGKVELSQCIFKLSIIDFAGSLGGTILCFISSQLIYKYCSYLKTILSYAGKYSLVILFFHSIDYCFPIWHILTPYFSQTILLPSILVIRLLFVTVCVYISLHSRWLRYFFKIQYYYDNHNK